MLSLAVVDPERTSLTPRATNTVTIAAITTSTSACGMMVGTASTGSNPKAINAPTTKTVFVSVPTTPAAAADAQALLELAGGDAGTLAALRELLG